MNIINKTLTDCPYCHSFEYKQISGDSNTVQCVCCGLFRLLPRMDVAAQICNLQEYESEMSLSDFPRPDNNNDRYLYELDILKRLFQNVFRGGTVLDVGCAEGSFLYALKEYGANPIGIEPVKKLAERGQQFGLKIRTGRFDLDGIPDDIFKTRSIDLVCFRECLYYMPDLREIFDLLKKILAPSGGIYIKSHTPNSIYYMKFKDRSSRYGDYVAGMASRRTLNDILTKEGYEIIYSGYYPHNIFHTLDFRFANSISAKIIGRIFRPITEVLEVSDRFMTIARWRGNI